MSFLAAGSFSAVAVLALLYSIVIYLYRSHAIRTRQVIKYHDSIGPSTLCGALFVAVVLNLVFELKERDYI